MSVISNLEIKKIDYEIYASVQQKLDRLAMPLGSLGFLHNLAKRIVGITDNLTPSLESFSIYIYAGDHGITQKGVSAYSNEITYFNTLNMLSGKSTVNAFANSVGAKLVIVDSGINSDDIVYSNSIPNIKFYNKKVKKGTYDCSEMSSMNTEDVIRGIQNGYEVTKETILKNDIIGIGEMGIGNTSIASLIISYLLQIPIEQTTGSGSGLNQNGVINKINTLKNVLNRIKYVPKQNVIQVLSEIGGHEINGMIGTILCAAEHKKPVLIDGFIASAAALSASLLYENIGDYLIFCTKSTEPGHSFIYEYFKQTPLLSLGLRLGEGTGVALAYPLVKSAVTQLSDIAELGDISIDKPNPNGYYYS